MDLHFQDPTDIPLPPDEVRIRELRAEPWPDGRRVRILLELTPFQKHPNGEILITGESGEEVASLSIIESIDHKMDFTIHLRLAKPAGQFTVSTKIFYYQDEEPPQKSDPASAKEEFHLPTDIKIVDQDQTTFSIEAGSAAG
jgi:hypothetical protein